LSEVNTPLGKYPEGRLPVELADFARRLPDEVWAVFGPILPERVWVGNGRPPIPARECLHGIGNIRY